jgi:chemotaxis protein MotB
VLSHATRARSSVNIWPGFVDMLASVLLVFIFMLMIFVVAQFFLADLARSRFGAIDQLSTNLHALLDELNVEKAQQERLREDLQRVQADRDGLRTQLTALTDSGERQARRIDTLQERLGEQARELSQREEQVLVLNRRISEQDTSLRDARALDADARARIERLDRQLADLRSLFHQVSAALSDSQRSNERYELEVGELGRRLNIALAEKVQTLSRYRSDFFGRMRDVLGNRDDIQIAGDRFVFQSELLFDSGSAELAPAGRTQLDRLAGVLESVAAQIPADVDWILRVDGHTDRRPIRTADFPSNWELSTARALSIVRYLIDRGIPPHRLAAAGFGQFRPLDDGDDAAALARNRRIEIKFTGP